MRLEEISPMKKYHQFTNSINSGLNVNVFFPRTENLILHQVINRFQTFSSAMILEGKIAVAFCIAYILLVLTIFQEKHLTKVWDFVTRGVILGLILSVTWFVPHSSIAKRAAAIGTSRQLH